MVCTQLPLVAMTRPLVLFHAFGYVAGVVFVGVFVSAKVVIVSFQSL